MARLCPVFLLFAYGISQQHPAEIAELHSRIFRNPQRCVMTIHVKNMVCDRCIMVVKRELDKAGLAYKNVQLGQVELVTEPTKEALNALQASLEKMGFEILDDRRSKIVEQIKNVIISLIHRNDDDLNMKLSALLQDKLQLDYHYLTTLFSSVEGVTIERYTILQRVERIKELLMYDEMNLSEIAFEMGYSSVQHLSQQFKKTTGLTPSQFKNLHDKQRKPLDKV